ncbi:MAG: SGNH/GDSL hydrolase N-terminal domain-containing protein [Candidatus Cryptobacteroides sp.]
MKKIVATLLMLFSLAAAASGNTPEYSYTEASSLTLVGKLMPDTPNPYHRVDTVRFKGFTPGENAQVRMSSGIAVAFRTDSKSITIQTDFAMRGIRTNTTAFATCGYDLYIRKDGKWLWAASGAQDARPESVLVLIDSMDGSLHDCLLYLPIYSEESSIRIGTEKGSVIEPLENPFRHRIAVLGSSYTHGISISRAGMTYPAQLSRSTGLQMLSLGCSGNCKLQSYFADVLAAADVDAIIVDGFSNPTPEQMRERLFPFIRKIREAHPGIPIIFQKTIYRETRNFRSDKDESEAAKMAVADSLMAIALKEYDDIYYIAPCATDAAHETSQDGIHPGDYGYTLWAESIRKPLLKILRKYGIR